MASDPEPNEVSLLLDGQGTTTQADPDRPELPHLLEMKGRMRRIVLKELKALVSEALCLFRKLVVTAPEVRRGAVFHRSVHLPSSKSFNALLATLSRRPAATSSSSWRSQCSASKRANHLRKAASCLADRFRTALSISLTVAIFSLLERCASAPLPAQTDCPCR